MLPPPAGFNNGFGPSSLGLSSPLSKTVLLKVKITVSADVHFTTIINAYVSLLADRDVDAQTG